MGDRRSVDPHQYLSGTGLGLCDLVQTESFDPARRVQPDRAHTHHLPVGIFAVPILPRGLSRRGPARLAGRSLRAALEGHRRPRPTAPEKAPASPPAELASQPPAEPASERRAAALFS